MARVALSFLVGVVAISCAAIVRTPVANATWLAGIFLASGGAADPGAARRPEAIG